MTLNSDTDLCLKISNAVCLTDDPASFIFGLLISLVIATLLVFSVRMSILLIPKLFTAGLLALANLIEKRRKRKRLNATKKLIRDEVNKRVAETIKRNSSK